MRAKLTTKAALALVRGKAPRMGRAVAHEHKPHERLRLILRGGVVAALMGVVLAAGYYVGSARNSERYAQDAMRAAELQTGKILFTTPGSEMCRAVTFDNNSGATAPGGEALCIPPRRSPTAPEVPQRLFSWGGRN
jgi:hypothetical protein